MGKQSRLKRERREKRGEHEERIEANRKAFAERVAEWSTVPDGASYGRCGDPECPVLNCLDPHVSVHEAHGTPESGKVYDPLVVVTYSKVDQSEAELITFADGEVVPSGSPWLRINGEDLGQLPPPFPHVPGLDQMQARLHGRVVRAFGDRGWRAFIDHGRMGMSRPRVETPQELIDARRPMYVSGQIQVILTEEEEKLYGEITSKLDQLMQAGGARN